MHSQNSKKDFPLIINFSEASALDSGVIVPHAGYRYSGRVAAAAYQQLQNALQIESHKKWVNLADSKKTNRSPWAVSFLFYGESVRPDYVQSSGHSDGTFAAIKQLQMLEKLKRDQRESAESFFIDLTEAQDLKEHSLEMQFPFLFQLSKQLISLEIVPLMIGHFSSREKLLKLGEILSDLFLMDESTEKSTFFVVSSDFCHYGCGYRYTPFSKELDTAEQKIRELDGEALRILEAADLDEFDEYLSRTGNTICGKFAIKLMLAMACKSLSAFCIDFVAYERSGPIEALNDSSVGYAAGRIYSKEFSDRQKE